MKKYARDPDLKLKLERAIAEAKTMQGASRILNISYQTFRSYAKRYGLFKPNPGGNGTKRGEIRTSTSLQEILLGKHPGFTTGCLKGKLLKAGLKKNECEECGLVEWRGKPLTIQLEHVDGDRHNHRWDNLKMLCPNCHSQTPTYCGRNVKHANVVNLEDTPASNSGALNKHVGSTPTGGTDVKR